MIGILLAVTGCTGDASSRTAGPTSASTPTPEGTPLGEIDTSSLVVRRASFCDRVDADAVRRALAADPTGSTSYGSGDQIPLTEEVTDVSHEYGCAWTGGEPEQTARAWVFAPPVTRARARTLVLAARQEPACDRVPGAASYGAPSVALVCRVRGGLEVSHRGLFGDAWLTCTLTGVAGERTALQDRADRWCAAVASAAASD